MRFSDFWPSRGNFSVQLAEFLRIPSPILCCSGTAALIVSLKTLVSLNQQTTRDTVIIPAFSCPLVVLAIVHCGLKVQLCDTAPSHFDFDFVQLKKLANRNTLAIISTHLGGRLANVEAAKTIARSVGASVIEDAAQALGAKRYGQSVGLEGDCGFFSLAVGKGLTTFEGGVLFSASIELHQALQSMAKQLMPSRWFLDVYRCINLVAYYILYRPHLLPYVYGMGYRRAVDKNRWAAALGDNFEMHIPMHALGKWREHRVANALERLPDFLTKTAIMAKERLTLLQTIDGLHCLDDRQGEQGVWPCIMILLPDKKGRDRVLKQLTPLGVGVSRLFAYPLSRYDYLTAYLTPENCAVGATPRAADLAGRLVTITNSPWLDNDSFERILKVLNLSSCAAG